MNDFIFQSGKSKSLVREFLRMVKDLSNSLIIKVKNKLYIDKILLEYFKLPNNYKVSVSYFIFRIINYPKMKVTREKMKKEANSQFELYTETLYNDLSEIDWNLFGGVTYSKEVSIEDCIYFFEKLYRKLKRKFGSHICLFYTSEKDKARKSHHNHFVLKTSDIDNLWEIKYFIDSYFRRNNRGVTDIRKYDGSKPGLRYIMKDIPTINDGFEFLNY